MVPEWSDRPTQARVALAYLLQDIKAYQVRRTGILVVHCMTQNVLPLRRTRSTAISSSRQPLMPEDRMIGFPVAHMRSSSGRFVKFPSRRPSKPVCRSAQAPRWHRRKRVSSGKEDPSCGSDRQGPREIHCSGVNSRRFRIVVTSGVLGAKLDAKRLVSTAFVIGVMGLEFDGVSACSGDQHRYRHGPAQASIMGLGDFSDDQAAAAGKHS